MHIEAKFFEKFCKVSTPLVFYTKFKGNKFLKGILFDLHKSTKFGTRIPD